MKLIDAITNVDRSNENTDWANLSDFSNELGLSVYGFEPEFESRVKKHWLFKWLCTDTHVGLAVYYFDDEPLAVSFQPARKSDEEIKFVSKEIANKLRDFILSFEDDESISKDSRRG
jgi:hypothetical protein